MSNEGQKNDIDWILRATFLSNVKKRPFLYLLVSLLKKRQMNDSSLESLLYCIVNS